MTPPRKKRKNIGSAASFVEVSCEYRRREKWPAQIEDVELALKWLEATASELRLAARSTCLR